MSGKSMQDVSLDLESYTLDDLARLFGLCDLKSVGQSDMKAARKVVMMTHPDKSGLDKSYFQFFAKAYERLSNVVDFANRGEGAAQESRFMENYRKIDVEVGDDAKGFAEALKQKKIITGNGAAGEGWGKWKKEFDKWFEANGELAASDTGYDEFMRSTEGLLPEGASQSEAREFMESRKRNLGALVAHEKLVGMDSWSSFGGRGSYAGEDLMKAYTETVVPVTDDDFKKIPKYSSLDEYKRVRHATEKVSDLEYTAANDAYMRDKVNSETKELNEYYDHMQRLEKTNDGVRAFMRTILRLTE